MLDTSGYVPRCAVRRTVRGGHRRALLLRLARSPYYADYREPRVESDPAEQLADGHPDDRLLEDYANYGALKALCEQEVVRGVSATARSSSAPA